MGFGGSVAAMLATLKNNKRERTSRFDSKHRMNTTSQNASSKLVFKKLNDKDLYEVKKQIQQKASAHNKKVAVLTIISLVLLAALILWLFLDSGTPLV